MAAQDRQTLGCAEVLVQEVAKVLFSGEQHPTWAGLSPEPDPFGSVYSHREPRSREDACSLESLLDLVQVMRALLDPPAPLQNDLESARSFITST